MVFADVGFGASDSTRQQTKNRFTFETEPERQAFFDGIEAAIGWFEYEVFDEGDTPPSE